MQHILQHIDNNQLDAAFATLDQVAPQDYTYNRLKQEFVCSHTDVDYLSPRGVTKTKSCVKAL